MSSNVPPQVQVVTESAYFVALHFGQTIIRRSRPESNQYPIKPSTTLNGTANTVVSESHREKQTMKYIA